MRALQYGSSQTKWKCHDEIFTTSLPVPMIQPMIDCSMLATCDSRISEAWKEKGKEEHDDDRLHWIWVEIIKLYTGLELTVSTDRLPVISRITTKFAKILQDECWGFR